MLDIINVKKKLPDSFFFYSFSNADRSSNIYMQMADAIDPDAAKPSSHAINDDTVGGVGSLSQRMHEEVDDNDDDSLSKRR